MFSASFLFTGRVYIDSINKLSAFVIAWNNEIFASRAIKKQTDFEFII